MKIVAFRALQIESQIGVQVGGETVALGLWCGFAGDAQGGCRTVTSQWRLVVVGLRVKVHHAGHVVHRCQSESVQPLGGWVVAALVVVGREEVGARVVKVDQRVKVVLRYLRIVGQVHEFAEAQFRVQVGDAQGVLVIAGVEVVGAPVLAAVGRGRGRGEQGGRALFGEAAGNPGARGLGVGEVWNLLGEGIGRWSEGTEARPRVGVMARARLHVLGRDGELDAGLADGRLEEGGGEVGGGVDFAQALEDAHALVESLQARHSDVGVAGFDVEEVDDDGGEKHGDARGREVSGQVQSVEVLGDVGDLDRGKADLVPGDILQLRVHRGERDRRKHLRTVERTGRRQVHHLEQGPVRVQNLLRLAEFRGRGRRIPDIGRKIGQPVFQLLIAPANLERLRGRLLGHQHHGRLHGAAEFVAQDRILGGEDVTDAETQFRLLDEHQRELLLVTRAPENLRIAHHAHDLGRERLELEIIQGQHGDVTVVVLDAHGTTHAQRDQTIPRVGAPPDAFPHALAAGIHARVGGVAMQADGVGQGQADAHPVPGVLLVVGRLVPIGHQQERLNERNAVHFVVEVIQQPCALEKGLAGRFSGAVPGGLKMPQVDKRGPRKHDRLKEEQTHPTNAIVLGYRLQEILKVEQWHVRMHIVDVGLQQLVAQSHIRHRQGTFHGEVVDVLLLQPRGKTADIVGKDDAARLRIAKGRVQ